MTESKLQGFKAAVRDNGWGVLPGFLGDALLRSARTEAERLLQCPRLFSKRSARGGVVASKRRSDRVEPVLDLSPFFAELARNEALAEAARALLGPTAQLMKDKLIVKPPGAGGYALHQDAAYWQQLGLPLDAFVTLVICLDPMTRDNGCIEMASGANWSLLTAEGVIDDPQDDDVDEFTDAVAAAGDLIAIGALTPHRSGRNETNRSRRALFLSFAADPKPGLYDRYADFRSAVRASSPRVSGR